MRRAAKVDANHSAVVSALRQAGCFVQDLSGVGNGCPDLLVGRGGRWYVLEVKDGAKSPSRRKLTPDEARWHEEAARHAPVHVVEDCVGTLGVLVSTESTAGAPVYAQ